MGHTPGPWEVAPPGYVDEHYAVLDGFGHTASVYGYPEQEAVALANARLIAAAPELLAALQEAVTALNVKEKFPVYDTDSYAIAARCDKAIAKAEGRSE